MKTVRNEDGFVLIVALLIIVILTIIGIAATNTAVFELKIAGNDRLHKKTQYEAEAGAILSAEVLEQNINCTTGFSAIGTTADDIDKRDVEGSIRVYSRGANKLAFYLNDYPWTTTECNVTSQPVISYPLANIGTAMEETTVWVGGVARMLPGGSLQMAAGYEGKGKSAATGGAVRTYDIIAKNEGVNNAESVVLFGWRHVIGTESTCNYD